MIGIRVLYKNDKFDWFDPVVEWKIESNILLITMENGNIYDVEILNTKCIDTYKL
jgi:hypothetical protein